MSIVASVFLWIIPLLAVAALGSGAGGPFSWCAATSGGSGRNSSGGRPRRPNGRSQEKELEKMKIDDL